MPGHLSSNKYSKFTSEVFFERNFSSVKAYFVEPSRIKVFGYISNAAQEE